MEKKFDDERTVIRTPDPEEPRKSVPSPGEIFGQVIGWVVAAVLVTIVPVLILCREPGKILAIVGSILGIAIVYTIITCTGWRD